MSTEPRCKLCPRYKLTKSIRLDGTGSENPVVMLISDRPSEDDDRFGRAFSQESAIMLLNVLRKADLDESDVYTTYAARCAGGESPLRTSELRACRPYLMEEIDRLKPKVIVTFGKEPMISLFDKRVKIAKARGSVKAIKVGDISYKVFPTWSPFTGTSYNRSEIIEDLRRAKNFAEGKIRSFDSTIKDLSIMLVDDLEVLAEVLEMALEQPMVAFDTETRQLDPHQNKDFLVTLQMALSADQAIVVPIYHPESNLDKATTVQLLDAFFREYKGVLVGHNGKFDQKALYTILGFMPRLGFDTMIAQNLLTGANSGNDLKSLTWKLTDFGGYEAEIEPEMEAAEYDSQKISLDVLTRYGGMDALMTFRIGSMLHDQMAAASPKVRYLSKMMAELSGIVAQMEMDGCRLDWDLLAEYEQKLLVRAEEIKADIYKSCGSAIPLTVKDLKIEKFNPASSRHVAHLMYKRLKIRCPLTTPGGKDSVARAALEKITHPIGKSFLELSGIAQQMKLYIKQYPKLQVDGWIHPTYSMIKYQDAAGMVSGTVSGRFSSSNPNVQQLPKDAKGDIRKAFIPDNDDSVIVDVDFNQLELRVCAMYCQDPDMMRLFNEDGDYHQFVASTILGVPLDEVTKEQRGIGKTINFALLYGAGPEKIAGLAKISEEEAKAHLQTYFQRFPAILRWKSGVEQFVRQKGYIDSLFGRRRVFPEIKTGDMALISMAMRAAVNHTCQSAGADLCFTAICRVRRMLDQERYKSRFLMTVHDSICFSVPMDELLTVVPKIVAEMQEPRLKFITERGVKIRVDAKVGRSFGELEPFEKFTEGL